MDETCTTSGAMKGRRNIFIIPLCVLLSLGVRCEAAGLTYIPVEFTSIWLETWESFPHERLTDPEIGTASVFEGKATAAGTELVIYTPGESGPGHFGLGPFTAKVHDGNQGFGMSSTAGYVTFSFEEPVTMFGGFWGIASAQRPVTVTFRDADRKVVADTEFFYSRPNDDGTLEWHGWAIDEPVSHIEIAGAFFVGDSLRAHPIPEPSALHMVGVALLAAANLRKRSGRSKAGSSITPLGK